MSLSHVSPRWMKWLGQIYDDRPQKGGCPAKLTSIRNVNHKKKHMPAITPRTMKRVFCRVIETVPFALFQIMYGSKATRKSPAYFSVRTTSLPFITIRKITGADRIASMNNTTKMLLNIFVRTAIILVYVLA